MIENAGRFVEEPASASWARRTAGRPSLGERRGPPPAPTAEGWNPLGGSVFQGKSHVVFSQGLGGGSGAGHVVQFCELTTLIEGIVVMEAV
jgi:hypothetical protein